MMMSGILAQEGAQGGGKGQPLLGVLLDLVDALHADFDRILDGGNIAAFVLRMPSAVYSVTVLPEPVGPGHQHHAVGLVDRVQVVFLLLGLEAQLFRPRKAPEESRIRSTIFSPHSVGQVETRKSKAWSWRC
jgi:hypothetical protein